MVGRLWLVTMRLEKVGDRNNVQLGSTYNVARKSMTVRLTWITMVRNCLVNICCLLNIWLRNINIPVGRVT